MRFRLKFIPTAATLAMLPVLLWLGFWQLDRAEQKASLQSAYRTSTALPEVPLTTLAIDAPQSQFRRVKAVGRFDAKHQWLLDNQLRNGRPGFHVYTPLRLSAGDRSILINRGWVPLGPTRQDLPAVELSPVKPVDSVGDKTAVQGYTRKQEVEIIGRIGRPANPGILLDNAGDSANGWPRVVQHVDSQSFAAEVGYPLTQAIMLLDAEADFGFVREWQPRFGGFGPERHRGYAVQWFGLAITLVIIYLVVNLKWQKRQR